MSQYVTLTINVNLFREIIDGLEEATLTKKDYSDIEDMVHIIDFLEEEYNEDMHRQNNDFKKWQEQEKMFQENNIKDIDKFMAIKKILKEHDVKFFDSKPEFHLICDLMEIIYGDDVDD